MNNRFGSTGRFPRGHLDETDEGELVIGVATDKRTATVVVSFGARVAWVGMSPDQARALAAVLIQRAEEAEKIKAPELPSFNVLLDALCNKGGVSWEYMEKSGALLADHAHKVLSAGHDGRSFKRALARGQGFRARKAKAT